MNRLYLFDSELQLDLVLHRSKTIGHEKSTYRKIVRFELSDESRHSNAGTYEVRMLASRFTFMDSILPRLALI